MLERRTHVMDDATFEHLCAWADTYLHEGSQGAEFDAMLEYFCTGDDEDRQRYLDHGWPHLYNLIKDGL
jgi:hypothetical protein